ncbi:MAG: exodeoxyribonuclease VII small subunit [bacterium]|nr:exodeoxyribonuclease VII small subunit [bacterium]
MLIEKNLNKLECLVDQLESEDIDLNQAVELYGKAVKLAADTIKKLNKVENKITLIEKQGSDIIMSDIKKQV